MMEIPPHARAEIDQAHAQAQQSLRLYIEQAKRFIDEHGFTDAPFFVAKWHVRTTAALGDDQIDALSGALGLALVELVRRERESP